MVLWKLPLLVGLILGLAQVIQAQSNQPDPNFHVYLLFGQSNMAGGGAVSDSPKVDCDTTPRVKVLSFADCSAGPNCKDYTMKRTHDQWYTAFPPLHDCSANLEGISPGDWFGKTMMDSVRSDVSIGLVPCALSGMALSVFLKGSTSKSTVGPPEVRNQNAYNWMLNRLKLAQQKGVIKGMLLHQGESGSGTSQAWDAMAMQIFNDLKTDLNLDAKTVMVVGQLRSDSRAPSQNNTSFNTMVAAMPGKYPNIGLASSQSLSGNGKDVWHFNPTSMRELGRRYAKALLALSDATTIPRKSATVGIASRRSPLAIHYSGTLEPQSVRVFTPDGKRLPVESLQDGFLLKGTLGDQLQVMPE